MLAIKQAADIINSAQRPIIYAGNGSLSSPLGPPLLAKLSEIGNIPVTTTLQGLGAFDESSERSLHVLGRHSSAYANLAIQNANIIIDEARYSHAEMTNPDFILLAQAMGVHAIRCEKVEELPEKMKEFLEYPGDRPVLMECLVETDEHVFPDCLFSEMLIRCERGLTWGMFRFLLAKLCMNRYCTSLWCN